MPDIPLKPYLIDICAAARLAMNEGMVNGDNLRLPFVSTVLTALVMACPPNASGDDRGHVCFIFLIEREQSGIVQSLFGSGQREVNETIAFSLFLRRYNRIQIKPSVLIICKIRHKPADSDGGITIYFRW